MTMVSTAGVSTPAIGTTRRTFDTGTTGVAGTGLVTGITLRIGATTLGDTTWLCGSEITAAGSIRGVLPDSAAAKTPPSVAHRAARITNGENDQGTSALEFPSSGFRKGTSEVE
jgi:hypothetical protein